MKLINYQDTATFFKVKADGYGNNKSIDDQDDVSVVFLQNTKFTRSNFKENIEADAICYPDPLSDFVIANFNRLEGMYILAPLFDIDSDDGWYKVTSVTVNRDHLLTNTIDNIELLLKKTRAL